MEQLLQLLVWLVHEELAEGERAGAFCAEPYGPLRRLAELLTALCEQQRIAESEGERRTFTSVAINAADQL